MGGDPAEQRALLRAVHDGGDSDARERLIEQNLPLARAMARRYSGRGEPFDDLVQIATIGLIKAIDRYDPAREVPLESYAIPTMVGELKRHFRDRSWAVHVPRRLKELNLVLVGLVADLTTTLERSPSVAELAQAAGVEVEEVLEALESGEARTAVSLSTPVGGETGVELGDTLAAEGDAFERSIDRALLGEGLVHLAPRERVILYLRFFEGRSQSQIAAEVGISQMQVSRLIRQSLARLRDEIEEREDGE
jgi:RNA polymerase sigma-B factor